MKTKLTFKEAKLVQAKAKGLTHRKAYRYAYNPPKTTKESTIMGNTSKILSRPHVQEALQNALIKHDITLDNALAPVAKGLKALKQNEYTGEVIEDLNIQLKASDRALKLLGVNGSDSPNLHFHQHIHKQADKYDL